jgi:hypothetical protein
MTAIFNLYRGNPIHTSQHKNKLPLLNLALRVLYLQRIGDSSSRVVSLLAGEETFLQASFGCRKVERGI